MNGSCMCWDHSLDGLSLLTYTIEYVDILSSTLCILTLLVIVCNPVIIIISSISIIPLSLHHFCTSFSYTNAVMRWETTNDSICILNMIVSWPLQLITSYYHIFCYHSSSIIQKQSYYQSAWEFKIRRLSLLCWYHTMNHIISWLSDLDSTHNRTTHLVDNHL